MPNNVLLVLKNALYKAIEDPEVARVTESCGYQFEFRKHEEFTEFVKEYNKILEMVVKEANISKN